MTLQEVIDDLSEAIASDPIMLGRSQTFSSLIDGQLYKVFWDGTTCTIERNTVLLDQTAWAALSAPEQAAVEGQMT